MSAQVVIDWDGTVTEVDTLHLALERFGDVEVYAAVESRIGNGLTLQDAIAAEMKTITSPVREVVDYLTERVVLRAGFASFVERFDPLVVSMGFHEVIDPLLSRHGIEARVVANRLDPRPEGWRCVFRSESLCEVCGEPCKRSDVGGLGPFAYVGDGISDQCIALAATRVFACDALAAYLAEHAIPFERFVDFDQLSRALGESPP